MAEESQDPIMVKVQKLGKKALEGGRAVMLDLGEALGRVSEEVLADRANTVMVRVNDETQRRIDELVEAGLFRTRSESAAFLLHAGIKTHEALFAQIESTVNEIRALKEKLRSLVERPDKG